uniref:hypothetical protein n=1 Tax=Algoriphagus sp. TaxID=1872435 RepID=UPI004047FCC2
MLINVENSLLIILLFLGIAPHFLWIRWIIRAVRKRYALGRVLAPVSYIFFLVPSLYLLQGSRRSYKRIFDTAQVDENFLLGIFLLSFLIPAGYFYGRWVYAAYRQKTRKSVYVRLSLLLLLPAIGLYVGVSAKLASRRSIGQDLGISIPYWGTSVTAYQDKVSSFRGEGEIRASLVLDADALAELQEQIQQTPYYDSSKLELYGSDGIEWPKSDTLLYWRLRDHLEATRLTGLWVYEPEKEAYEFYEPSLSDIPNSSILFKESYVVSAEVNLKNRTLSYRRWQF